jgi:hypothetical protein
LAGIFNDLYSFDLAKMAWTLHSFANNNSELDSLLANLTEFNMSIQQQTWTLRAGRVKGDNSLNKEMKSAVIAPTDASSITLQFDSFSIANTDSVSFKRCFNIECTSWSGLGTASGSTIPRPVTCSTGFMLIQWSSEGSTTFSGWSATWFSVPRGMIGHNCC